LFVIGVWYDEHSHEHQQWTWFILNTVIIRVMVSVRLSTLGADSGGTPRVYVAKQCLITYWLKFSTMLV